MLPRRANLTRCPVYLDNPVRLLRAGTIYSKNESSLSRNRYMGGGVIATARSRAPPLPPTSLRNPLPRYKVLQSAAAMDKHLEGQYQLLQASFSFQQKQNLTSLCVLRARSRLLPQRHDLSANPLLILPLPSFVPSTLLCRELPSYPLPSLDLLCSPPLTFLLAQARASMSNRAPPTPKAFTYNCCYPSK